MSLNKTVLMLSLGVSMLVLTGCSLDNPNLQSKEYAPNAQVQRQWKRLDTSDIGVAEVRLVKPIDTDCAGSTIPIPGEENFKTTQEAFANYWKEAFITDLRESGYLNQSNPKVKIYNLIESVRIQADPSSLVYEIDMTVLSSNGNVMKEDVSYSVPSDDLKNIREGCARLADGLDRAVAWSILKTISDPRFENLITPGLGYVPTMKAESLTTTVTDIFTNSDSQNYWKTKP